MLRLKKTMMKKNLPKSISIPSILLATTLFSFVGLREIAKDQIGYWGYTPTSIGFFPESVSPVEYKFRLDEYTTGQIYFSYSGSAIQTEAKK